MVDDDSGHKPQGYSERERLSQYLWMLRSRVVEGLGIPEWSLDLRNPDGTH